MIPDTLAELSQEDAVKVQKLTDALEDLDDVQDVFTNADLPEED
jgi:transcriptional/translational regulatory protein YebC/TACO1